MVGGLLAGAAGRGGGGGGGPCLGAEGNTTKVESVSAWILLSILAGSGDVAWD